MLVAKNVISSYSNAEHDSEEIKKIIDEKTYPNLYALLSVAYTLPISSATCERSFSAMRRIKNWLRTSMSQSRFSNLAVLNIENDITNTIDTDAIIDQFALINRKISLQV